MKKNKNVVCMLAMASIIAPSVASIDLNENNVAYASDSVEKSVKYVTRGNGGGDGSQGNPYQGIEEAINNAPAGSTLILTSNVSTQNANSIKLIKNLIIDGQGLYELELKGSSFELNSNFTFKNLNLAILRDGRYIPKIYANGHKLEFDNVSTKVSNGQQNERPELYGGSNSGDSSGSKSIIIIKGDNTESKFAKIYAKGSTDRNDIPVDITVDSSNTNVLQGMDLSSVGAPVNVVTKSKNIKTFVGDAGGKISLSVEKKEGEDKLDILNFDLTDIQNITLKNSTVRLTGNPGYVADLKLIGKDSLLTVPSNKFADDDYGTPSNNLIVGNVSGDGILEIPEDYTLRFPNEYNGTANVRINNNNQDLDKDRTYIVSKNGNINVTYTGETSNKLEKNSNGNYSATNKTVTKLENETLPIKVNYKVGETFDTEGMEFKLKYNDQTEAAFKYGSRSDVKAYLKRKDPGEDEYFYYEVFNKPLQKGDTIWVFYGFPSEDNIAKYNLPITIIDDSEVAPIIKQVVITKYAGQNIDNGTLTFTEGDTFNYDRMEVALRYVNNTTERVSSKDFDKRGITFNIKNHTVLSTSNTELVANIPNGDSDIDSTRVVLTVKEKLKPGEGGDSTVTPPNTGDNEENPPSSGKEEPGEGNNTDSTTPGVEPGTDNGSSDNTESGSGGSTPGAGEQPGGNDNAGNGDGLTEGNGGTPNENGSGTPGEGSTGGSTGTDTGSDNSNDSGTSTNPEGGDSTVTPPAPGTPEAGEQPGGGSTPGVEPEAGESGTPGSTENSSENKPETDNGAGDTGAGEQPGDNGNSGKPEEGSESSGTGADSEKPNTGGSEVAPPSENPGSTEHPSENKPETDNGAGDTGAGEQPGGNDNTGTGADAEKPNTGDSTVTPPAPGKDTDSTTPGVEPGSQPGVDTTKPNDSNITEVTENSTIINPKEIDHKLVENIGGTTVEVLIKDLDSKNYKLKVQDVTKEHEADVLSKISEKVESIKIFDINLVNVNTETIVKTDKNRTVRVLLTENLEDKTVKVYHIDDITGELTLVPSSVENNTVVFSVNHFSKYAITISKNNDNQKLPNTGGLSNNNSILGIITMIIALGMSYVRRVFKK